MEGDKETMKKTFVIIRVSSQDQLKGYGPDVQWEDDVIPNAALLGLEVSDKYRRVIQERATTWERAKFEGLMREALSLYQNNEIEALLFPRVDRETRFIFGSFPLLCEVVRSGLKVFFARERFELDPRNAESTERYLNKATQAQAYVETLRLNTMRGRKKMAKEGKIPHGGFGRAYGYDYDKTTKKRTINETETYWVRQMYALLVNEGLSTNAITYRLRELNAPAKFSQHWNRNSVLGILKNPAYTGKTYAFTFQEGTNRRKPKDEWIEILGATPAIITEEMFQAAQEQLELNFKRSKRNTKRQYLLRSHLYCRQCGRAYCGHVDRTIGYYRCPGKLRITAPVNRCHNNNWRADKLEALIWEKIEGVLDNPDLIIAEIEKQREDFNNFGTLEPELQQVEKQLKALDHEQQQLLQWALKGFPEEQIIAENKCINQKRSNLQSRKANLEKQIEASHEAAVNRPKLETYIQLVRDGLSTLDFDMKRLALDMLNIKVWVDGSSVEITGSIPVKDSAVVTTSS